VTYEAIISLGISTIGVLISGAALIVALKSQRTSSELARKQLEQLTREEAESRKARLTLEMQKTGPANWAVMLQNASKVDAFNVQLKFLDTDDEQGPIVLSEYRAKLPVPKLSAGATVKLVAFRNMQSPRTYTALLTWTNPDGADNSDEVFLSW